MFREAVERFFTEFLADKPYDEAAEKMLEEARKDFLAGRIQQEPLVLKAREIAGELGLLQEVEVASSPENLELTESPEQEGLPGPLGAANQSGIPSGKDTKEEGLSEEDSLTTEALEAMRNLQQAVGGELLWEARESRERSSNDLSHVGRVNSIQDCILATSDQTSNTPNSSRCDSFFTVAKQECPEPLDEHTHSKVTPLRTPFQGQPSQTRFEVQAPTLLKELLAHLKFNPDSRFPTKAQRKALLRRDRYCCRTPGCTNHLFLEIHHIKRFSEGGKTLPQFLVTLCSRCHKNTEEGKLYIRLTDNGQLVFTDKNGNNLEDSYRLERAIWLDYWLGWKGTETDSHWARAVGFSDSAA